jgi:hypothetical protein
MGYTRNVEKFVVKSEQAQVYSVEDGKVNSQDGGYL